MYTAMQIFFHHYMSLAELVSMPIVHRVEKHKVVCVPSFIPDTSLKPSNDTRRQRPGSPITTIRTMVLISRVV
jgi:hypothetical protein